MYAMGRSMSDKEKVASADGSLTLFSKRFNESYHSTKDGALRESLHKHVIPALQHHRGKRHLRILDICFGLGYNTLATLYYIQTTGLDLSVEIVSPEFDEALVRSLKTFAYPSEFDAMRSVIEALSSNFYYEDKRFKITILIGDAREAVRGLSSDDLLQSNESSAGLTPLTFDIIYQDAFSPKVNPTLWTKEWFADLRALSNDDTILTTYSIASVTRMGLYENGFRLYYYDAPEVRRSLLASPGQLEGEGITPIDMAHKIACNPEAKSLKDKDVL